MVRIIPPTWPESRSPESGERDAAFGRRSGGAVDPSPATIQSVSVDHRGLVVLAPWQFLHGADLVAVPPNSFSQPARQPRTVLNYTATRWASEAARTRFLQGTKARNSLGAVCYDVIGVTSWCARRYNCRKNSTGPCENGPGGWVFLCLRRRGGASPSAWPEKRRRRPERERRRPGRI